MNLYPKTCNLCGGEVLLVFTGKEHSKSYYIYKCKRCGASVGTCPNEPDKALGLLAKDDIKQKRAEAHNWFDKLWRRKTEREELYAKLAQELNINLEECHFAYMDEQTLDKALVIIKKWWREKYEI